jgi:hypothetical protein
MPKGVGSADQSLEPECWTSTIPCPDAADVDCVKFKVCTTLVPWAGAPNDHHQAAAYRWDATPEVTTEENCKVISYSNEIMIDAGVFGGGEGAGPIGQTMNEGLLYHEMLHAQLGIEALNVDIANEVCACMVPNPTARSDQGHTTIPGLQDGFVTTVAAGLGANVQVRRINVPAETDGSFRIDLGDKPGWTGVALDPAGGNVRNVAVSDPDSSGSIILTGELVDPGEAGHVIVLIDPPSLWFHDFIRIEPGATSARSSSWGRIKTIHR